MRWAIAFAVGAVGCGRLGFDAVGDAVASGDGPFGDGAFGDGPPAVSCGTLAPTCGPTGTSPCCESPIVTGGMFYRSYDVGTDMAYLDMSYPATVSTFRLDKYEITVGRFRQFVNAGFGTRQNPPLADAGARTLNGAANQGGWDATWNSNLAVDTASLVAAIKCEPTFQTWTDAPAGNESRPMNCITWYEAHAFCAWDGGFLPTEAEWNYAAVGGSLARAYPWSSPPSDVTMPTGTQASYFDGTCIGDGMAGCALTDLVPVGSKPAGDGLWGQSDLAGNVTEWVLDWFDVPYPMPCTDCANLTVDTTRAFRGGLWSDEAYFLRTGNRTGRGATARDSGYGVRCARTP